jgi:hypothetical protein
MAEDFYVSAAAQRLSRLDAEKQQSLADLARARSNADYESAAYSIQQIANLEAERANLINLHQQYQASINPPRPPEPSKEERAARRWDQMDATDILNLARTSRHAADLQPDDPAFVAGMNEVIRRRQRGGQ